MKDKVIKLDTSKKLQKVAEDLPESEFVWAYSMINDEMEVRFGNFIEREIAVDDRSDNIYPAYTVGELLEILPEGLTIDHWVSGEWSVSYRPPKNEGEVVGGPHYKVEKETPQEALSRLLIKLIEEGIYETRE